MVAGMQINDWLIIIYGGFINGGRDVNVLSRYCSSIV